MLGISNNRGLLVNERVGSSPISPRAQTLVVTRTFSLPSLKRSMTAALCSTCISPLSSATWWPSLDSSPASQPAVFLVYTHNKSKWQSTQPSLASTSEDLLVRHDHSTDRVGDCGLVHKYELRRLEIPPQMCNKHLFCNNKGS